MKFLLVALSMAFASYLGAQTSNQDEASLNGVSDQALDMADGDASYWRPNGPTEYAPPIIHEVPYNVVRKIPVVQRVIDVYRPVIKTVKVPITVRERRYAPAVLERPAPPPQGGGDQGPPPQGGGDQGPPPQGQGQGFGGQSGQPPLGGGQQPQFQGQMPNMGQQQGQQ